jgi:ABC-type Mn2+/Zn2+ transport system ATPase subunit
MAAGAVSAPGPLVEFDRARLAYGRTTAVEAHLSLGDGCFVGLVGPSGAGKTTLLRAIVGEVAPRAGAVRVGGVAAPRRPAVRIGYVPQRESVDWQFPITVAQTVLLGLAGESGPWPWPSRQQRRALDEVLARLGIGELARRPLRALSGGQQQRVFLARALIRQPELLLLDEPTAGLDVVTGQDILRLLAKLNGDGVAVVLTTHDLNTVANQLPDLVCLNRRIVARGRPEEVLTPAVLATTFGSEMAVFHHGGLLVTADIPAHDHDGGGAAHPHRLVVDHGSGAGPP